MYTLSGAAEAVGLTKSAFSKAIKKGCISAKKDEFGRFAIDPAELHRVYPPLPSLEKSSEKSEESEREATAEITAENRELKARLEVLNRLLDDIQKDRDDLHRRLDDASEDLRQEREERRRITALLTDQRAKAPKAGFLGKAFWRRVGHGSVLRATTKS